MIVHLFYHSNLLQLWEIPIIHDRLQRTDSQALIVQIKLKLRIYRLNKNLRLERIIFIIATVIVAAIAAFSFYKGYAVSERSEVLSRWYEENNEAILFGRYLRVNENDRWRWWHDKWVKDPGLKEDMSDYFMLEELKKDKEKK